MAISEITRGYYSLNYQFDPENHIFFRVEGSRPPPDSSQCLWCLWLCCSSIHWSRTFLDHEIIFWGLKYCQFLIPSSDTVDGPAKSCATKRMVEIPNKKWWNHGMFTINWCRISLAPRPIRVLLGTPGDGSQPGRTQEPPGPPGKGRKMMENYWWKIWRGRDGTWKWWTHHVVCKL